MNHRVILLLACISNELICSQLETYRKQDWALLEAAQRGNIYFVYPDNNSASYRERTRIVITPLRKLMAVRTPADLSECMRRGNLPSELHIKHFDRNGEVRAWYLWRNAGADKALALCVGAGETLEIFLKTPAAEHY